MTIRLRSRRIGTALETAQLEDRRRRRRAPKPEKRSARALAAAAMSWAALAPVGASAAAPAAATAARPAQAVAATSVLEGVACPNTTICQAVGFNRFNNSSSGVLVPVINGTPGIAQPVAGTSYLVAVGCPTDTTCVAVGSNSANQGVVVTITNGAPGAAQVVSGAGSLNGVACPSATTCQAVGNTGSAEGVMTTITNGTPGAAQVIPGTAVLVGSACASATTCEAVGFDTSAHGVLVTITNGTPGTAQLTPANTALEAVACATATTCQAVGVDYSSAGGQGHALVVPITNGTLGSGQMVVGALSLGGVACPTATTCEAVGTNSTDPASEGLVVPIVNGIPAAAQGVAATSFLGGVACPSAASCQAVGDNFTNGVVVAVNASAPSVKGYTPLTPMRVCDTRAVASNVVANQCQGPGGSAATLGKGSLTVKVAGVDNVPATAIAVVLNVTATNTTAASYLTVWPTGLARPTASNLNWTAAQTVPNLVEVAVGADGSVSVYNNEGGADVVIDVEGFVDAAAPGLFNPVAPARICDSRAVGTNVAANQCQTPTGGAATLAVGTITPTVAGVAGIPLGATAVVLNVTVTNTTAAGFLTVWPDGASRPLASNLNWRAGQTVANRVIVPLGTGGKIDVYNSAGATDVVIDVNGYYSAGAGSGYLLSSPVRICDTRPVGPAVAPNPCNDPAKRNGPLGPGGELTLTVPGDVTAMVFNVTVTGTTASSYVTVFPDPKANGSFTPPPLISDLNWAPGQTVANLVVVSAGSVQAITVYNNVGMTDVVVDLEGAYSATPAAAHRI